MLNNFTPIINKLNNYLDNILYDITKVSSCAVVIPNEGTVKLDKQFSIGIVFQTWEYPDSILERILFELRKLKPLIKDKRFVFVVRDFELVDAPGPWLENKIIKMLLYYGGNK